MAVIGLTCCCEREKSISDSALSKCPNTMGVWAVDSLATDMGRRAGNLDFQFRRQMWCKDLQHLREDFWRARNDVAGIKETFVAHEVAYQRA